MTDRSRNATILSPDSRSTWTRRECLRLGSVAAATVGSLHAAPSGSVRVLLVTGGHGHEPSFYSIFDAQADSDAQPRMTVNVEPHPFAFRSDFTRGYDVLALYDMVQFDEIEEARRRNLQKFVESGKGVVILHHALCSYNSWEWWWRSVAGVRYLQKPDGAQTASTYRHDENLRIRPASDHPVLAGVGPMEFVDETYKRMWMSPTNKVLLTTDNPTSDGPVAWVSAYEKSRVVVIQPGHGREAHLHPGYRRLVRNAVLWNGRVEVPLQK